MIRTLIFIQLASAFVYSFDYGYKSSTASTASPATLDPNGLTYSSIKGGMQIDQSKLMTNQLIASALAGDQANGVVDLKAQQELLQRQQRMQQQQLSSQYGGRLRHSPNSAQLRTFMSGRDAPMSEVAAAEKWMQDHGETPVPPPPPPAPPQSSSPPLSEEEEKQEKQEKQAVGGSLSSPGYSNAAQLATEQEDDAGSKSRLIAPTDQLSTPGPISSPPASSPPASSPPASSSPASSPPASSPPASSSPASSSPAAASTLSASLNDSGDFDDTLEEPAANVVRHLESEVAPASSTHSLRHSPPISKKIEDEMPKLEDETLLTLKNDLSKAMSMKVPKIDLHMSDP